MNLFIDLKNFVFVGKFTIWIWLVIFDRQLDEPIVQNAEMEGFMLHLQNNVKDDIIKEETGLHLYSIGDVEM